MSFQRTTAIDKLLAMKARKRVVQGGTSAGKTVGIIAAIADWGIKNPKKKITIVAETIPAVKDGALDIFIKIMEETGRWIEGNFLGNPMEYYFTNGTVIQFKAFDTVGKAKSAGKRDLLFLNEANHISYNIADTLMMRSLETWIDYNPDERFWVHNEVLGEANTEFLLLKYTDNEGLPPETLEDLQEKIKKAGSSPYWKNWCRVYIDGEIGNLEGVVFDDWNIVEDKTPGTLIGYGIDFGFVHSPTTIIQVNESEGDLYIKELLYKTGMHNDEIFSFAEKNIDLHAQSIADCAEPKTIDYLFRKGWKGIKPAIKGEDSVRSGIDLLLQRKLHITNTSLNTIKEFRNYRWDTDKDGRSLNKPIKDYDHAIDAIRYLYSYPKKRTNLVFA